VKILSLKSVLLYQLDRTLVCDFESNVNCFTNFLRKAEKGTRGTCSAGSKETFGWRKIPLQRKQKTSQILYVSPLPQALSSLGQVNAGADPSPPMQTIINRLNQSHSNLELKRTNKQTLCPDQTLFIESQLWLEFKIETQKPGWIAFCLSEKGLNRWLRHLKTQPSSDSRAATVASHRPQSPLALDAATTQMLWQTQYAHACCARLLRQSRVVDEKRAKGIAQCESVRESHSRAHRWNLQGPLQRSSADLLLVHTLIDTADSLFWIPYQWPTQQYLLLLKGVMPLCQAFERFYRVCLCGSVQYYGVLNSQEIAERSHQQTLINATKNILKVLLEDHLGEQAPDHL